MHFRYIKFCESQKNKTLKKQSRKFLVFIDESWLQTEARNYFSKLHSADTSLKDEPRQMLIAKVSLMTAKLETVFERFLSLRVFWLLFSSLLLFPNVSADMSSGLLQVFVELRNLNGTSNYVLYWRDRLFWFRKP